MGPIIYALLFLVILFMVWTTYSQQRRSKKAQEELMRMLRVGDEVVTIGGMFGTVREIGDDFIILETEDGGQVRFLRRAVREIVSEDDEYLDDEDDVLDEVDEETDDEADDDESEADDEYVEPEAADPSQSDDSAPTAPTPPEPPKGVEEG